MFCSRCGKENEDSTKFCIACGAPLAENTIEVEVENKTENTVKDETKQTSTGASSQTNENNNQSQISELATNSIILGLVALFFGSIGVHNFIMGYTKKAVTQLLLSVLGWIIFVGPVISAIWAIVDAVMLFSGTINKDGHGNILHR